MRLIVCHGIFFVTLFSAGVVVASEPDVAAIAAKTAKSTPMQGCVLNVGMGSVEAMKNMAKKFGPEAALDMMFSSVNPVFQPALLSKTTDPAKPAKDIQDMRDNKYFLHAITTTRAPPPWVMVTTDGRMIIPWLTQTGAQTGSGWMRLPSLNPGSIEKAEPRKADSKMPLALPNRY